ncbi:endonuclease/exonuclease/phosphatase family protein [Cognatishimia sp. F0-27]|uniref:endonuclease/exonuclease/phosphatase family protein n=1 Tax=Cognatishimia sp. F0-27 TaxID=2816855 RepID=UPI001D0C2396|nr:endonuclease/exonuclease/phosphatase family protein [Cognatishimia sp. F0-27]MCC1493301.1 endonuclease [Cognatishimia sp. F0-27]
MRFATYNVEWFDALFDNDGTLLDNGGWSARHNVTRAMQIDALIRVFREIDADAVMIIEAPDTNRRRSTTRALSRFAEAAGLRARSVMTGFVNDTQQEIALLFDPDVISVRHAPGGTPDAPRFDDAFHIDLDIDATLDTVTFSKPPLELAIETASGVALHMIGAHLKSKAPHGAKGRDAIMRLAIANRRKQLAQAIWLRKRVSSLLADGQSVILAGDLNDGPGLDSFEALFGRSSVEILMGAGAEALYDPHAARALAQRIGAQPSTARFFLKGENRYLQALLDYLMISADLRARAPRWRIWHPFDDPVCWQDEALRDALLTASDHFPVTLDLDL